MLNILIPAAGQGSRFADAGFVFPKPLIQLQGKPMLQCVVDNLKFKDARYIFLLRKEHIEKYDMESMVRNFADNVEVVVVDSLTEGAACTALLAKDLINTDDELLIANSDQIIEYCPENFEMMRQWTSADGIVFTFHDTHPKWSFVKLDDDGKVTQVVEKKPISNIPTCGIYYYRTGKLFVDCAEEMIKDNERVNNEFYIAPVYNRLIAKNKVLLPFFVEKMHGVGDPESFNQYLNYIK